MVNNNNNNNGEYTPSNTDTEHEKVDQFEDEEIGQSSASSSQTHQQLQNRSGGTNDRAVLCSFTDGTSTMDEQFGYLERKIHDKVQHETSSSFNCQSRGAVHPVSSGSTSVGNNSTTNDIQHRSFDDRIKGDEMQTNFTELDVTRRVVFEIEYEDTMFPAAIDFDRHHKYTEMINSHHRRQRPKVIGWLLLIVVVIIIAVSVTTGIVVSKNKNVTNARLVASERFIMATIPRVTTQTLRDHTNPYAKALLWMVYDDPQQLDPAVNGTFLQRYYLTYYYYATSTEHDWDFCYPMNRKANKKKPPTGVTRKRNGQYTCRTVSWSKFQGIFGSTFNPNYWLSHKNECSWANVVCDTSGHVTDIITIGSGQNGNFPPNLSLLPFLTVLEAGPGNFIGTLPDVNYKTLLQFAAPHNKLTGTIPTKLIRDSRMLIRVQLSLNNFTGIELGNLTGDMKALCIENTDYGGKLDNDDIERLTGLYYLDVSNCNIHGTIPPSLLSKPYITLVEMTNNQLTGTIPSIGTTDLSRLLLQKNNLIGTIPDSLYEQPSLSSLLLADNKLNGTISDSLGKLTFLNELSLDTNAFSGTIPDVFGNMKEMSRITMVATNITGTIPSSLCNRRPHFISQIDADCLVDDQTNMAEVSCPDECCTTCCNAQGENCAVFKLK